MLIKHKQWHGKVCNAWGGHIVDPYFGQTTDDGNLQGRLYGKKVIIINEV